MRAKGYWGKACFTLLLFAIIVVGVCYAHSSRRSIQCSGVTIEVADNFSHNFISTSRLEHILFREFPDPVGHSLYEINTTQVEQLVGKLPAVRQSEAFVAVDGVLRIKIHQREPLLRIIDRRGRSCYVARDGVVFDAVPGYSAHTLVASGRIELPTDTLRLDENRTQGSFYPLLFNFSHYLYNNDFWRAQVAQIYVLDSNEIEIVPRVGSQIVAMGSLEDYEYKLQKLRSLYSASLPGDGLNAYSRIDLRYGNQVVCTKK